MKTVTGFIKATTLQNIPDEWWRLTRDGQTRYLKVAIDENDIPDKYGHTHSLRVVLPQNVQRGEKSTYLSNFKPYTPDNHNENYK